MSDTQRSLFESVRIGARRRAVSGRRRVSTWLRHLVPASVLLRCTVGLAYFIAAELAVPAHWASAAAYLLIAVLVSVLAALLPAGIAPLVASGVVLGAWLLTTSIYGGAGLATAAFMAAALYVGHSAAAIAQRYRTTTAVDGEIMNTWLRHLGIVIGSTAVFAGILALFTAYFSAISPPVAVGIGIMAALTVIYVLARSLHNPERTGQN